MCWFICLFNDVTRGKKEAGKKHKLVPFRLSLYTLKMRKWSQKEISPQITSRLLLERKPLLCWKGVFPVYFKMKAVSMGTDTGCDTPQGWAQSRWHSLWSRVVMSMLHHGAGAFNPLHYKPPSTQCGHDWPIFLMVWDLTGAFPRGWWAPHLSLAAVCTPCRLFMASSENCLWAREIPGEIVLWCPFLGG